MSDMEVEGFQVLRSQAVRLGKGDEAGEGTGGNEKGGKGGMFSGRDGSGGDEDCGETSSSVGGHGRGHGDVTAEEREEQRETARCGELEMAEERKWEEKSVQDVEVAAMKVEERKYWRHLEEKNPVAQDEKVGGDEGNLGR